MYAFFLCLCCSVHVAALRRDDLPSLLKSHSFHIVLERGQDKKTNPSKKERGKKKNFYAA
jgi:hypothetical protein